MVWRRKTTVDVGLNGKEKCVGVCARNGVNPAVPDCDESNDANDECWSWDVMRRSSCGEKLGWVEGRLGDEVGVVVVVEDLDVLLTWLWPVCFRIMIEYSWWRRATISDCAT